MGRGIKIALAALAAFVVLLIVNTLVTNAETKPAERTQPGGRILELPGANLQVVDRGPRGAAPVVLIHCFTCSIEWWEAMIPRLAREHRVVAIDLLGHGGSEKPRSGYEIENQAALVAQALASLGIRDATVAGHSLGGPVAIALAERSPALVDRLVIIDSIPDTSYGDVGVIGELPFAPVIGQALWRVKPNFAVRDGLEVAFAPGFPVPDSFVEGVKRLTYSAYDGSHDGFDAYTGERPLPQRAAATGLPTLAIMGAEEQIADDPAAALAAYKAAGVRTVLIRGAGHSPNVERPALTARLLLDFARLQDRVQDRDAVRTRP